MKSYVLAVLTIVSSLVPFDSFAELPELLTPVTGSEEAIVTSENDYFLKKHLYFAKRHRIVRVDLDLLESVEQFTISLFDDVSLAVEVTELDVDRDKLVIRWKGRVINPKYSFDDLNRRLQNPEDAKSLHDGLFGLSISAGQFDYDEVSGANLPSHPRRSYLGRDRRIFDARINMSKFYGVSAEFSGPTLRDNYILKTLEMGGAYHILIEVDPTKTISPGPFDDPDDPEMGVKRRQYEEFLQSLGEDPRRAIIRREQSW